MEKVSLARIAYHAYGSWVQWKTPEGKRLPSFEELPMQRQNAWTAAAETVAVQVRKEERSNPHRTEIS